MWINWRLTLMTFFVLPIVAVVIRYFSRRLRRIARDVQTRTGSMTHVLEEMIGGHRIVRIFGGEAYERSARGQGGQFAAKLDDQAIVGERGELAADAGAGGDRSRRHHLGRARAKPDGQAGPRYVRVVSGGVVDATRAIEIAVRDQRGDPARPGRR